MHGEDIMTPTTSDTADVEAPASDVTAEELRRNIDADKYRALEAVDKAKEELSSGHHFEFVPDITGKPNAAVTHTEYVRDQLRGLEVVLRTPFYYRVDTMLTMRGQTEPMQLLLSKARDTGGAVYGDGWMIVSWTSPIANLIQGRLPGDTVEFTRRQVTTYEVGESSKYEALLPQIANAVFVLRTGEAAIASEADLEAMLAEAAPPTALPPREYSAKPTFGLSDIIVLVDEPQRAAMALPFDKSVVIEGPPGSGKTSIGIMRIAVLYDQQWDALGLKRAEDRPFHDYSTMRVLVYNDEMVEYLRGLAQSIGVEHVHVETTKDFLRRVCRATRLLTGTERRDKPSLAILKGRREALHAYFAGFKSHIQKYWKAHEVQLRQSLFDLGPDFLALAERVHQWVSRVTQADVVDGRIAGGMGLADSLTQTVEAIRSGRSPTRRAASRDGSDGRPMSPLDLETVEQRLKDARKIVEDAIRGACSRAGITQEMFTQPEYGELLAALRQAGVPSRTIEDGDRLWRTQYKGELPAYSELDLAMTAWLGAPILLSTSSQSKPWIGGRLERSTHIVVDEAQDLSPSHIAVLASQLVSNGTMTLVGDIHQNLNPHAGLQSWNDTGLSDPARSAFGVNHRQTFQLGTFLAALHSDLFDEKCPWRPSERTIGKVPRIGIARSWAELAAAVAREATQWREDISGESGATIAVLYDGRIQPKRLRWLQNQLEIALSDQLIPVEVAMPGDGGDALRRTDRVVIASVRQTKGLEFDAVVFVEPRPKWSKPLHEIDARIRNGLYVATSRARAGLSICMSNLPSCVDSLVANGLCELVKWAGDRNADASEV
jgi:hypothetical protein